MPLKFYCGVVLTQEVCTEADSDGRQATAQNGDKLAKAAETSVLEAMAKTRALGRAFFGRGGFAAKGQILKAKRAVSKALALKLLKAYGFSN